MADGEYYIADNYITLSENDNSMLIKMDYRTLNQSIGTWSYNREIMTNVVDTLYENIKDNTNQIEWVLTAIKEVLSNGKS